MDFSMIPPAFPTASSCDDHPMEENVQSPKRRKGSIGSEDIKDDTKSLSDISDIDDSDAVALALSCRDEGSRKFKTGDLDGAIGMYEDGIAKIKNIIGVGDDDISKSTREVRLALNLNLSLCRIKQCSWLSAVQAATAALEVDKENVKGLFRRGMARSRLGFLEEARSDLLQACRIDPSNSEARKELAIVKQKEVEARSRDRKAFGGLFDKTAGMYDDREKQMKEKRENDEKQRKLELEEFEKENKGREERGEEVMKSFDEWKTEKTKKDETKNKDKKTESFKSKSSNPIEDLDEEDLQILNETKKMGYCYFNRKIDENEKVALQNSNRPVKIDGSVHEEPEAQKALSSWNSQGTTYEERDCSSWAHGVLSEKLKSIAVSSTQRPEDIKEYVDLIKSESPSISEIRKLASKFIPSTITISSVSPIEGDAQVIVLRSSKRYLYDFKIELHWTMNISDVPILAPLSDDAIDLSKFPENLSTTTASSPTTYSGSLIFTDVSSASSSRKDGNVVRVEWIEDAKIIIKSQPDNQLHRAAITNGMELLKNEVFNAVKSYEEDFKLFV